MRPRVFPAEDPRRTQRQNHRASRFNEAAGIPRGRPEAQEVDHAELSVASMRPRVFPAEDDR